jgi:hypothetical protein
MALSERVVMFNKSPHGGAKAADRALFRFQKWGLDYVPVSASMSWTLTRTRV